MSPLATGGQMSLVLHVELEKESDSRWIADVTSIPGVLVYGATPMEAFRSAQSAGLGSYR